MRPFLASYRPAPACGLQHRWGMATKTGAKKVTVTVGDLIAAAFDVVGDRLDAVVELLRFEEMRRRSGIVVEGAAPSPGDRN